MRVIDLIEMLQEEDPEAVVRLVYDYGDRSHTMVAVEVESVEVRAVRYNAYVNDYALVDEHKATSEDETAVVLQG